jgi:hypothetical protein
MSVFQSRLNSLITHSPDGAITSTLVADVLDKIKPSATHAQRLRAVVPVEQLTLPTGEVVPKAEEPVVADPMTEHTQLWADEIATPKRVEQPVSKEPYIVRYGRKGRTRGGGTLYRSNVIQVWTWPDGRKTLNCPWCGETRETANGIAVHVRAMHAAEIPDRRSEWVSSGEVTYEPSEYQDRKPSEAEETISLIRDLIGTDDKLLVALTMERDEWERRALKAEGDIQALKELLRDE